VPVQGKPTDPVGWQTIRLSGSEALAARASKKLRNDELLVVGLGPTILRKHLDDVLWRGGNHVAIRQLVDDFGRYLYLPRLAGPEVLINAMRDGIALLTWQNDAFAYAESYDEAAGRYRGLRAGQQVALTQESGALLVVPAIAKKQLDAEQTAVEPGGGTSTGAGSAAGDGAGPVQGNGTGGAKQPVGAIPPKRFHGTVKLDSARVGRDASRIADEVVSHLSGLVGAEVTVTLEIEAKLPGGASEQVVRTVTENSRTLKFDSHGFEAE
jgi:hypothetical protein